MFRFAPYILKSLWRHRARTGLTVTGTAVAMFVFAFVGAARQGLDDLAHQRDAHRTLIVFQANRFCPSTSRLPQHYADTIAKMPDVDEAVPIRAFMNNCRASLDVVVFHGLPRTQLTKVRELRLIDGTWSDFESRTDAALVGQAVARRRGIKVGERFAIGEVKVVVTGIFAGSTASDENIIYTDLDFLQRTPGLQSVGIVTQLEVRLKETANPEAVAKAIDERFHGGPIATDTRPKGVFQANAVSDLVELIGFANYLGYACVVLVLVLVATTTLMTVQDRVREHAVLQTLGFSWARVFRLVMAESFIVGFAGGLIGTASGLLTLAWSGLAIGTEGVIIGFTPSLALAIQGAIVSLVVGLLAGVVPAWQASRAEIVPSLRCV